MCVAPNEEACSRPAAHPAHELPSRINVAKGTPHVDVQAPRRWPATPACHGSASTLVTSVLFSRGTTAHAGGEARGGGVDPAALRHPGPRPWRQPCGGRATPRRPSSARHGWRTFPSCSCRRRGARGRPQDVPSERLSRRPSLAAAPGRDPLAPFTTLGRSSRRDVHFPRGAGACPPGRPWRGSKRTSWRWAGR